VQAHQHATNADEYIAKGLLIPAADEHQKSADAFQSCIEASNDENVCMLRHLPVHLYPTTLTPTCRREER
jgi:Na+-translocating ferredoxin:NAD+ oxidoreductase RnfC subunit